MARLILPALLFLVWVPAAYAWSWPVDGPVLQPFAYDESHPYAAGQHRGIDIGAEAAGEQVVAPAAGVVTFAGSVPTSGECVTIETPDGYSATLTHLGSILVAKGASVAEGSPVGTIGPSGTPEFDRPYVHLGIRVASDPEGYVDPLGLLPPPPQSVPTETVTTASQPSTSGSSSAPAAEAAPASSTADAPAWADSPPTSRGSSVTKTRARVSSQSRHVRTDRTVSRQRSPLRSASRPANAGPEMVHQVSTPHRRLHAPTRPARRPIVEAAAPGEPNAVPSRRELQPQRERPTVLIPLACNGAAALVALAAALVAMRRRHRGVGTATPAEVLHLPRTRVELERDRHAA
jgi:hypothetical protein